MSLTALAVAALPSSTVSGALLVSSAPKISSNAAPTTPSLRSDSIATAGSSSLAAVTKDVVALLKALSSGNVSESKASLARLQADIKTLQSASATVSTASEQPPFNVVLNSVAESLAGANTGKALQELADYLIRGGQATGNIVDERA